MSCYFALTHMISDLQLYSAGLICENSPEFDDLFGFSVEDVENEVKRGRKLVSCFSALFL